MVVIFGAGFPGSRAIQSAHVDPKLAGMPLGRGADLSVRDNPEMRFEDQIMFKDKYASISSGQMEAFVLSFKYIGQRAGKLFTNS